MTRIPETALHRIWERHSVLFPRLRTRDGRAVRVISAGTPNPDSGPDFHGAVIRIGATTFHGDVEIHTTAAGWQRHHHHTDPRYNRVILHVVGEDRDNSPSVCTASGRRLPLLVLPSLTEPFSPDSSSRETIIASCAARLQRSRDPRQTLSRLGWTRIRRKSIRFEHRLHQLIAEEHGILAEPEPSYEAWQQFPSPPARPNPRRMLLMPHIWEQLVYEALMESMGYARNGAAFLLLARTTTLRHLRIRGLDNIDAMMSILFGEAGLLPAPETLSDEESAAHVRRLRHHWRTAGSPLCATRIPEIDWVFFRLRPANFPTARIATVAFLLPLLFAPGRLCALLEDAVRGPGDERERLRRLRHALRFTPEGYWAHHLHFRDRWKERGVRLGNDRITIILLNGLIPIALLYAGIAQDRRAARRLRRLARALPSPHEPRMCSEIREGTLGKKERLTAVEQAGLLEMMKREGRRKREEGKYVGVE